MIPKSFLLSASALLTFSIGATFGQSGSGYRAWWPQQYEVTRDDSSGTLRLSTRYYTFEHDLKMGGALSRIHLNHGRADNLLVRPMETRIRLRVRREDIPDWQERRPDLRNTYSDLNDSSPKVTTGKPGKWNVVTVEAALKRPDGTSSGVTAKTTYQYRWGYVKVRKQFLIEEPVEVVSMTAVEALLDPSLSDYGWRPAAMEENGHSPFSWTNGMIRGWGKMRPGTHLDLPFRTRFVPRYVVLGNRGVEGIEFFVSDALAQWDYQVAGQPGNGFCEIGSSTNPRGIRLRIEPLSLPWSHKQAKGGYLRLQGTYTFDYYFGVPVKEANAQKLWLHESARGVRDREGNDLSESRLKEWAASGIREITLHNDGDSFRDGIFWRDGSYPPYPPDVMKKMDAMIDNCHKHGIRIAPYFSNHELHQSTEEFKKHGEEWGLKPDDQGNLRPQTYYGTHMCLKSGWLEFLKHCVDRALKNHKFDGAYFDWNLGMYCNNPLHVGKKSNGVNGEKGLASLAISETGHWDIDELIQLVEWTRERVGPNGLFILHNTLVPMYTTENFADHVVGTEFGYGKLSVSMPPLSELPLEWDFAGARSRAAIVIGTVANDAPPRMFRQHALAGLMTAVMPWRANADGIEFAGRLRPLGNLEAYKFEDYRNAAVQVDAKNVYSAVYSKPGEAYVLLANFNADAKTVSVALNSRKLPHPLSAVKSAKAVSGAPASPDVRKLTTTGAALTIPADDVVVLQIK